MNDTECAIAILGNVLTNPVVTKQSAWTSDHPIPWTALQQAEGMLSHSENVRVHLAQAVHGRPVDLTECFGRLDTHGRAEVLTALVLWVGVPAEVVDRLGSSVQ